MTALLVPIFSALGGVLAGLMPVLLVSERRRLLKLMREESASLAEVEDQEAQDLVRESLRASASRYHQLASQTKVERARRQFYGGAVILYFPMVVGAILFVFGFADGDGNNFLSNLSSQQTVGLSVLTVTFLALVILLSRMLLARGDQAAHDERLKEAQENSEGLAEAFKRLQSSASPAEVKLRLTRSNKSGTWRVQDSDGKWVTRWKPEASTNKDVPE